jgi:hypothetical protein
MNTQNTLPEPISLNTDLINLLQIFHKNYPILNCFYSINLNCANEISMQGNFNDFIFDYLLLNGFTVIRQKKFNDDSLVIYLIKQITIHNRFAIINVALIDKKD